MNTKIAAAMVGAGLSLVPVQPAVVAESAPPGMQLRGDGLIAVPVHWSLRVSSGSARVPLGVTLTIHNLSASEPVTVPDVAIADANGNVTAWLLSEPRRTLPFGTLTLAAPTPEDVNSGIMLVMLHDAPATAVLAEAVMAGDLGGRGYVVITHGKTVLPPRAQ